MREHMALILALGSFGAAVLMFGWVLFIAVTDNYEEKEFPANQDGD